MARAATTTDAFNAIAEASRRDLLDALGTGEASVTELVDRLGLSQPKVSKHLAVLRTVGLVRCTRSGRRRVYRVDAAGLRPVHDWVRRFEVMWNDRLDRLDDLLVEIRQTDVEQTVDDLTAHDLTDVEPADAEPTEVEQTAPAQSAIGQPAIRRAANQQTEIHQKEIPR